MTNKELIKLLKEKQDDRRVYFRDGSVYHPVLIVTERIYGPIGESMIVLSSLKEKN